jgi:hypothetical protein
MADKPISVGLLDDFIDVICEESKIDNTEEIYKLLNTLVKRGLIPTSRLRNHMIVTEYYNQDDNKRNFCIANEERYGISENRIYHIINNHITNILNKRYVKNE